MNGKPLLIMVCALLLSLPALAQEEPADAMIKAVVSDLNKYEKQAEGLTPGNKRQINNILHFLPMTEARLGSSRNRDHQSWIDASARLKALKSHLEALKAGKGVAVMTDAELSRKYQQDYRSLSNEIKRTHISKFVDPSIVTGFKTKLAALKGIAGSFKQSRNRSQFMSNYDGLEKWFNQKVTSTSRQASAHQAQASARASEEQARKNQQAEVIAARDRAGGKTRADNLTREAQREAKVDKRRKAAAVAAEHAKQREAAANSPDAQAHREFSHAYQNVRVTLQFLDPGELAKPKEATYWRKRLKEFEEITSRFENRENPDVKKDLKLYASMRKKIEGGLQASEKLSISSYPEYQKDLKNLLALTKKYDTSRVFTKGKELKARQLYNGYDKDKKLYDLLHQRYKPFMDGNRSANHARKQEADALRRGFRTASEGLTRFAREREQFISGFNAKMDGYLKEINTIVARAQQDKNPQFFTGGVQQRAGWAEDLLTVYGTVLGDHDAKYIERREQLDHLKVGIKKAEADLREAIIVARKTPPNGYSNKSGDMEKLLQMTRGTFHEVFPDKEILASGISSPAWERTTEWRTYSNGEFYKTDYSKLYVWVIAKKDGRLASIYFSKIYKLHLEENRLKAAGFSKQARGYGMLLTNVHP